MTHLLNVQLIGDSRKAILEQLRYMIEREMSERSSAKSAEGYNVSGTYFNFSYEDFKNGTAK